MNDTFTQTVIMIGRGPDAWAAAVGAGVDAVCEELAAAQFTERWARFTSPSAGGRMASRPIRIPHYRIADITAVFEQEVSIENDPRAFGQHRTPGGIQLPN